MADLTALVTANTVSLTLNRVFRSRYTDVDSDMTACNRASVLYSKMSQIKNHLVKRLTCIINPIRP